jgi:serralysin
MSIDPNLDAEVSFITGVTSSGQLASQSFWAWNGDTPPTYGASEVGKWGASTPGTSGGVVTYGFDPGSSWTATEQQAFTATFALWSEVANIQFVQSANPVSADIDITRSIDSSEGGLNFPTTGSSNTIQSAFSAGIQIATSVPGFGPLGASFSDYGGYPWMTLIHEEGHALGLGHAGPYDEGVTTDSQDDQVQFGPYDTRAYSVMSYIDVNDPGAAYYKSEPLTWNYGGALGDNGEYYDAVPTTPQIADILAIQRLYGLPTSTPLSGGQTFGFNCNVTGPTEPFFDFTKNTAPVVTLWDAGGNNTLDVSGYSATQTINLNPGTFSSIAGLQNNVAIAYGTEIDTVIAGSGTTTIYANSDNDRLVGGSGFDTFYVGSGTDTYIGSGDDQVVFPKTLNNYYELGNEQIAGVTYNVILPRDGGGAQYIDRSIVGIDAPNVSNAENVPADLVSAGLTSVGSPNGGDILKAPGSGTFTFDGGLGVDRVILGGNVQDYTLSRVPLSGGTSDSIGAFVLTATNGTGVYTIDENISIVQFQNGQYLSLKDLPAYVHGNADLQTGGSGNDLLFQNVNEPYQLFVGGGGSDDVYLNGNVGDYRLQPFTAVTPQNAAGTGDQSYSGLELVATNGSGALLIDQSIAAVTFKDGQYLSYGDLHSYVAASANPSTATLDINLPGDFGEPLTYAGTAGANTALLNGNVGDYTLSRDAKGDFVLDEHYATNGVEDTLTLSQSVTAVEFRNGQYLSLKDLGAYIGGSDVFTTGTAGNDLLFAPKGGDSYIVGGAGTDDLFLNGNTRDYTIAAVNVAATSSHPAVDGYELLADNGSGNIYIDQSVETVHFQNGQYLAFHDLTSYIDPFHG